MNYRIIRVFAGGARSRAKYHIQRQIGCDWSSLCGMARTHNRDLWTPDVVTSVPVAAPDKMVCAKCDQAAERRGLNWRQA